jgi:hypothetical protein
MTPATDGPLNLTNRLSPVKEPVVVHSPEPPVRPHWLTSRGVVVALVLLGMGLRVIPMVQNRNLWIDEAMLGLNLVERSPRQLLEPLDWNQAAPVGFLLAVKTTMLAFGTSEWAMRLFPFAGSVLGLVGFAWVARRLLAPMAATIAVALIAISPHLLDYSAECKQYATDAALGIGMFAAGLSLLQGAGGFRHWAVFAVAGAVAVWFSHPVAFVLGGVGGAILLEALVRQDRTRILACLGMIACWLVSFGTCYFLFVAQLGNNQFLIDYWAGHFLPLPPRELGDIAWLADHFFGPIGYPGGLGGTEVRAGGIAAVLFLVGVAGFWRQRWPVAVALVVPGLLALLASGLHMYPFAGRLLLFLVPVLILGVARGAWSVAVALWPTQKVAAVLFLGVLFVAPLLEMYQQIRRPPRHEQITEVLADLRGKVRPGDKVYLYYGGIPAYLFYTRDNPFPAEVVRGTENRADRTRYRDELRQFAGRPRVWLVFSHRHLAEESLLRSYAEGLGECRGEIQRPGATAFLFDFSKPEAPE